MHSRGNSSRIFITFKIGGDSDEYFDAEKELKLIRQDEREMGREEGLLKGILFCILDNLNQHVPFEQIIKKLQNGF